ncbi:MAG TPA: hypothetical protein VL947_13100 [Cytophagales bacterium]|nr:hypothetical protein [Cytophagales bacterium]
MKACPLSETDSYVLFLDQESIFLFGKDVNEEIWRTEMYGNVMCGLIDIANNWVVAGGKDLLVWKDNVLKASG